MVPFRAHLTETDADIIGCDFNTSAFRQRGKGKLRSIEKAWRETLLIPRLDLFPMLGHMKDSGDCCGFIRTQRNVTNWRVTRHGSPQNKDELLTRAAQLTKKREMAVFSLTEKRFK